ncbi:hypothetical protein BDN72DRAFT_856314 [Pluteus cervinus]|uniref:Uncharacterized protein n=1 Tax=Pluteus cervinus TaxID=181527 RepID=A0ACD3AZ55_9AGAR|nr:hypothetical protein BDN72DRAFT_856314 [Pluteus cervinus]
MPPRPALKLKQNRPLSAIYLGSSGDTALSSSLGSTSTPPGLPDLPEPPSPGASISSSGSGLPSPPATNSTGSGSTGDPASVAFRQRHFSLNSLSSSGNSGGINVFNLNESGSPTTMHHANRPGSAQNDMRRSSGSRSSSRIGRHGEDDDADDDEGLDDTNDIDGNDNDEDNTARLDRRPGLTKSSKENISALQRVKSLTQRNKMVLDKLTSIRLNSPSPSVNSHPRTTTPLLSSTRTSAPSVSSSSSSSSARLSQPQARHALRAPPIDRQLSGSETEREGSVSRYTHTSSSSSSHLRSLNSSQSNPRVTAGDDSIDGRITPPRAPHNQFHTRARLTSAPASPQKARLASASSSGSRQSANSESPSRRRKRTSMASVSSLVEYDEPEPIDSNFDRDRDMDTFGRGDKTREITQSALAAVASSRRSPLGTRKARGPLPREFRDAGPENTIGRRGSLDAPGRTNGRYSAELVTPHRNGHHSTQSMQYSPVKQGTAPTSSGPGPGRSSTVRGQLPSRWASEDLTHTSTPSALDEREREPEGGGRDRRERKQSLRAGSAESALTLNAGRSLVGQSLRAAGLGKREGQGGDVFRAETEKDRERRVEWSPYPESVDSTMGDRDGRDHLRSTQREMDGRIRAGQSMSRAATSMADYRTMDRDGDDDAGPRTGPILRGYRSAYPLAGEPLRDRSLTRDPSLTRRDSDKESVSDRIGSALGRHNSVHAHIGANLERYSSPFGTRRGGTPLPPSSNTTAPSNGSSTPSIPQPPAEHTRLMLDSLTMFESQISRLTGSVSPSASSAELLRNAQSLTFAAEKLNGLLRAGTARALEEQIDAEVNSVDGIGGGKEVIEAWRKFGGDYREGLRYSDDLVRGITGLLLGVGRVLRDHGVGGDGPSHSRNASLEDENASRAAGSPDMGGRDSRRSEREDAFRRLSARPESSLANRPSSAFNTLRERELQRTDTPPPNSATSRAAPRDSIRRLLTPREQREHEQQRLADESPGLGPSDSQRTIGRDYEPSPTPANRHSITSISSGDRGRTLPPLEIPKPVPTLPSESIGRRPNTSDGKAGTLRGGVADRRKPSVTSIATVRATPPSFSALSTPGTTTAVTAHTVSNGLQDTPSPLMRTDSGRSARSGVTFSRPSTVSVSTLSGLQQQDNRKRSFESGNASGPESNGKPGTPSLVARSRLGTASPMTPVSGSDAERESRRKTVASRMMRASLDGSQLERVDVKATMNTVNAADRSAASSILPQLGNGRRERRRTVTDIWPNGNE